MTLIRRLAHSLRWLLGRAQDTGKWTRKDWRGQSLAEFTLVLPILLIVLLGLLNLGLAIRAHLQLAQEAQEAAQILMYHPESAFNVTITGDSDDTFTLTTSGGAACPQGNSNLPVVCSTGNINFGATPATVQTALEARPDVGTGNVLVTRSGMGGTYQYTVTFGGLAMATRLTVGSTTASATSTPEPSNGSLNSSMLAYYLDNTLGSNYQITPSEISGTVGTSCLSDGTGCVLQDTVNVDYPFQILFPMVGQLSIGLFQNGFINLGATASTIAASHPVNSITVCPGGENCSDIPVSPPDQYAIVFVQPMEATLPGIHLQYCVTSDDTAQTAESCKPPQQSGSRYYITTQMSVSSPHHYWIAAQQPNGVTSDRVQWWPSS